MRFSYYTIRNLFCNIFSQLAGFSDGQIRIITVNNPHVCTFAIIINKDSQMTKLRNLKSLSLLVGFFVIVLHCNFALGDEYTWNPASSSGNTNWSDAGNWLVDGQPASSAPPPHYDSTNIILNTGSSTQDIFRMYINKLSFTGDASLTLTESLDLHSINSTTNTISTIDLGQFYMRVDTTNSGSNTLNLNISNGTISYSSSFIQNGSQFNQIYRRGQLSNATLNINKTRFIGGAYMQSDSAEFIDSTVNINEGFFLPYNNLTRCRLNITGGLLETESGSVSTDCDFTINPSANSLNELSIFDGSIIKGGSITINDTGYSEQLGVITTSATGGTAININKGGRMDVQRERPAGNFSVSGATYTINGGTLNVIHGRLNNCQITVKNGGIARFEDEFADSDTQFTSDNNSAQLNVQDGGFMQNFGEISSTAITVDAGKFRFGSRSVLTGSTIDVSNSGTIQIEGSFTLKSFNIQSSGIYHVNVSKDGDNLSSTKLSATDTGTLADNSVVSLNFASDAMVQEGSQFVIAETSDASNLTVGDSITVNANRMIFNFAVTKSSTNTAIVTASKILYTDKSTTKTTSAVAAPLVQINASGNTSQMLQTVDQSQSQIEFDNALNRLAPLQHGSAQMTARTTSIAASQNLHSFTTARIHALKGKPLNRYALTIDPNSGIASSGQTDSSALAQILPRPPV